MDHAEALGLIETRGFVPMIVAVDAMAKAANITVVGYESIGGGLLTAMVRGDIAAVRYAMDVGGAAARKVGEVISVRVIARPQSDMVEVLPMTENRPSTGYASARIGVHSQPVLESSKQGGSSE